MATSDHPNNDRPAISALILAGGRGSRLDGVDKGLLQWRGKALIEHCLNELTPLVDDITISCNRNVDTYAALGHPVVVDKLSDFQGPLAGIAAARAQCQHSLIYICPCDCPHAPGAILELLSETMHDQRYAIATATDGGQRQALFMLCRVSALPSIDAFLASGQRSVKHWQNTQSLTELDLSAHPEWFKNINRPEDLEA